MKKVFSVVSVCCLMFMAACGGGNSKKDNESANEDEIVLEEDVAELPEDNASDDAEDNGEVNEDSQESGWIPAGNYDFVDKYGTKYTLVVKQGGSAQLINHSYDNNSDYTPTNGSWSSISGKDAIELSFFSGPFVGIGDNEYIQDPVMTPEYLYFDMSAFESNNDYLKIKKVN